MPSPEPVKDVENIDEKKIVQQPKPIEVIELLDSTSEEDGKNLGNQKIRRDHNSRRGNVNRHSPNPSRSRSRSPSSRPESRSRSRSPYRRRYRRAHRWPPRERSPPSEEEAAEGELTRLARIIKNCTRAVGLSDSIKNLKRVCADLQQAVELLVTYHQLKGQGSQAVAGANAEFKILSSSVHTGLKSLYLLSNTAQGKRGMPEARPLLEVALANKQVLFTEQQQQELEQWMRDSKVLAAVMVAAPAKHQTHAGNILLPQAQHQLETKASNAVASHKDLDNQGDSRDRVVGSRGGVDTQQKNITNQTSRGKKADSNVPLAPRNDLDGPTAASPPLPVSNHQTCNGESHGLLVDRSHTHPAPLDAEMHSPDVDALLAQNKLCLVLDLDHTLLNSVTFAEVEPKLHAWLENKVQDEALNVPPSQRQFYRLDELRMWTKLRPGVREFLSTAAQHFELWIHTNGNKIYAASVKTLLDPDGRYFANRVIAQGADRVEDMHMQDQAKRLMEGLVGRDPVTAIVDDTEGVWAAHPHNLVPIERYIYFPSSIKRLGMKGQALLEKNVDENSQEGMLMITLGVLMRLHAAVFEALRAPPITLPTGDVVYRNWDVRHVLGEEKQKVLQGVCIAFSRVIPLGQPPQSHPLWQMAESYGARCSSELHAGVTHLVSGAVGTEKAMTARAMGKFVVSPGWLESSCLLARRSDEGEFCFPAPARTLGTKHPIL